MLLPYKDKVKVLRIIKEENQDTPRFGERMDNRRL